MKEHVLKRKFNNQNANYIDELESSDEPWETVKKAIKKHFSNCKLEVDKKTAGIENDEVTKIYTDMPHLVGMYEVATFGMDGGSFWRVVVVPDSKMEFHHTTK